MSINTENRNNPNNCWFHYDHHGVCLPCHRQLIPSISQVFCQWECYSCKKNPHREFLDGNEQSTDVLNESVTQQ